MEDGETSKEEEITQKKAMNVLKSKEKYLEPDLGKRLSADNQEGLSNLSILTIPEVAVKLKLTNNEAAKKWLEKRGIRIHKFSKQNLVYEIEVICEIDKPFVKALRLKYPIEWKNIYRRLVKDYKVYELLILQLEGELDYIKTTKVKRINESDEKLYNDLMR